MKALLVALTLAFAPAYPDGVTLSGTPAEGPQYPANLSLSGTPAEDPQYPANLSLYDGDRPVLTFTDPAFLPSGVLTGRSGGAVGTPDVDGLPGSPLVVK
jgi:hypothetical protein